MRETRGQAYAGHKPTHSNADPLLRNLVLIKDKLNIKEEITEKKAQDASVNSKIKSKIISKANTVPANQKSPRRKPTKPSYAKGQAKN